MARSSPSTWWRQLRDATPDDTIVVAGVGQHQMWASQYWSFDNPYTWVNSGGAGTMGFAVPAAIGAKVGRPDKMVWAIDGDGCFQMTAQELVTASAERIPIKIAILNNAYLGMVRQWQELFYEERYSEVYLSPDLPDYVKWAEAMGCVGLKVESAEEVAPAIEKANGIDDRPVVIDFRTDAFEKVYPMVPAGASNDDIIVGPAEASEGRYPMSPVGTRRPPGRRAPHRHAPWSRTRPASSPAWRRCSAGAASTSSRWPSRPPTTSASAASRSSSTWSPPRWSRSSSSSTSSSTSSTITELAPEEAVEREMLLCDRRSPAPRRPSAPSSRPWSASSRARSSTSAADRVTVMLAGTPSRVDDFEDLIRPFGIIELQRTGLVALPKLSPGHTASVHRCPTGALQGEAG